MSDDQSDAEFEASLAKLEPGPDADDDARHLGEDADEPLAAGRLESIHGTLSTLGMRIDALVTSTTTYRSALTDRLAEYSELVTKTARLQADDLNEYRKTAERTVSEVRRSMSASEEMLARLATRVDEVANRTPGDDDPESRRVVAEVRSILDAQERLGTYLRQSFEQFTATVTEQITTSQAVVVEGMRGIQAEVTAARPDDRLQALTDNITTLSASVSDLSGRDPVSPLRSDIAGVRDEVTQLRGLLDELAGRDATEPVRDELAQVRGLLDELSGRDPLSTVRDDLTGVRRVLDDLAGRDAAAPLREDLAQLRAIATSIAERDLTAHVHAIRSSIEELSSRDVVGAVRAELDDVRERLDALAAADLVGAVRADLAPVQSDVAALRDNLLETQGMRSDVTAIRDAVDAAAMVRTDLERIEGRLGEVADATRIDELVGDVRADVERVESRLDDLASGSQLRGLTADLRAHVTDALGGLNGASLRDDLARLTERAAHDRDSLAETLNRLQETLLDVASGEVVGALWDELRNLRADLTEAEETIEAEAETEVDTGPDPVLVEIRDVGARLDGLIGELRDGLVVEPAGEDRSDEIADGVRRALDELASLSATVAALDTPRSDVSDAALTALRDEVAVAISRLSEAPPVEPVTAVAATPELTALQESVVALTAEVRELLDAAEVEGDFESLAPEPDERIGSMATEIEALRDELREGLVVEPTPQLIETLEALQGQLAALPEVETRIEARLTAFLDSLDVVPEPGVVADGPVAAAPTASGTVSDEALEAVRDELKALRRRLSVKAAEKVLSDEQLAYIAEQVADRLASIRADA